MNRSSACILLLLPDTLPFRAAFRHAFQDEHQRAVGCSQALQVCLQAANQLPFRSRLSPAASPPCTQLAACSCSLSGGPAAGGDAPPRRSPLRWRGRGHSACRAPDRYQCPWAARGAVPPQPGAPRSGDGGG